MALDHVTLTLIGKIKVFIKSERIHRDKMLGSTQQLLEANIY